MQLCPDTRACCFGYFLQVQKRFRVTPGRPQELISRRQLYGDRCFGNKSSGITEAHSLPRVWQTRCQNAMECHGICLFHSTRLSLSPCPPCSFSVPRGSFYCRLASFREPFSIPMAHNQSCR